MRSNGSICQELMTAGNDVIKSSNVGKGNVSRHSKSRGNEGGENTKAKGIAVSQPSTPLFLVHVGC